MGFERQQVFPFEQDVLEKIYESELENTKKSVSNLRRGAFREIDLLRKEVSLLKDAVARLQQRDNMDEIVGNQKLIEFPLQITF